ncbi:DUF1489 family protein [Legionella sp.]|uniref:DUF1489 family protein n=1 Tax=Legionella sp. TaxID=459 RepID=UPI003CA441E8
MNSKLNIIKLAVGPNSLKELEAWQTQRMCEKAANNENSELIHSTRNFPRRAEEILGGGSIYWVIKGRIVGRNRILEFRPMIHNDRLHCGIVYDPKLIRVIPRPRRPFQGWRYLEGKDTPSDLTEEMGEIPENMLRELIELGVL